MKITEDLLLQIPRFHLFFQIRETTQELPILKFCYSKMGNSFSDICSYTVSESYVVHIHSLERTIAYETSCNPSISIQMQPKTDTQRMVNHIH